MLQITEIKPLFNSVLTTGDKYEEDEHDGVLITAKKGDLKLYQTVIAVGTTVRDIKVGDKIMFNPLNYAQMKYDKDSLQNDLDNNKIVKWHLPWVTVYDKDNNPKDLLLLNERDIQYVFLGEEKKSNIVVPDKKLVV